MIRLIFQQRCGFISVAVKVTPQDYARANRQWRGTVPLSAFERLPHELDARGSEVEVLLAFSLNEYGHVRMCGHAQILAKLTCHRCLAAVPCAVRAEIDTLVVQSDALARQLAQETDVLVIDKPPVDICELVEDDLILSIPWRVCDDMDNCPRSSVRQYLAQTTEERQHPFKNLRDLLQDS